MEGWQRWPAWTLLVGYIKSWTRTKDTKLLLSRQTLTRTTVWGGEHFHATQKTQIQGKLTSKMTLHCSNCSKFGQLSWKSTSNQRLFSFGTWFAVSYLAKIQRNRNWRRKYSSTSIQGSTRSFPAFEIGLQWWAKGWNIAESRRRLLWSLVRPAMKRTQIIGEFF